MQVIRRHHPGIPIHPDILDLNLEDYIPEGTQLHYVVITTPCVDVSRRGNGLAQFGVESNLFFDALQSIIKFAASRAVTFPTIISENVPGVIFRRRPENMTDWQPPFLKLKAEKLAAGGYVDIAWRTVATECFGLPQAKRHVLLVASPSDGNAAEAALFSGVRHNPYRSCSCVNGEVYP